MTFGGWLRHALAAFQLDDEAYTSYVEAIMKEEGDGEQDKKEAVLEFLSAATVCRTTNQSSTEEFMAWDADLSAFGDEMIAKWKEEQEKESKSRQNRQKQEEEATVSSVEDKNSTTQEPVKENRFDKQKVLSKEERKLREALLAQYGYELEQLDENGDIVVAAESSSAPLTATLGVQANTNASRIAEEEQRKRTVAKEKYQKKVQREKELLAIDKQRKEKRKQRTQKKEKRRGPG
ncbi:hypothetical protein QOT17_023001 [Balamuthia mandrillaris]